MKWTFLAGLGTGAAIGMLVAPKSGAQLRDEWQGFARDSYEQGREKLEPLIEKAAEKLRPALKEAQRGAEPLLEEIEQRVNSVMAQASDVRDRVVDKTMSRKERATNGGLLSILNEWPHERLIEIDGIGPVLAAKIIQHRPYESEEALLESKQLPPSAIESLKKAA